MEFDFEPSRRALAIPRQGQAWDLAQRVRKIAEYDPIHNPKGLIDLSSAHNTLMSGWLDSHLTLSSLISPRASQALSYGPVRGSPDLLDAAAGFFNHFFTGSSEDLTPDNILVANGVTSLIDIAAFTLCEPGDAALYFTPNFYRVDFDLSTRAGVGAVPVTTTGIEDPFDISALATLTARLDKALEETRGKGVRCRMLFICNPANPQARSYSADLLSGLSQWCTKHGLHLVSDEIYALSDFSHAQDDGPHLMSGFTSVLSLQGDGVLNNNIHVLYSLSKDFSMGGLRMGFLVTRNRDVRNAASRNSWSTWVPKIPGQIAAGILSNIDLLDSYVITYRQRLGQAYKTATEALKKHGIPFAPASAGLFVFLDLSGWLHHFKAPTDQHHQTNKGCIEAPEFHTEQQLCEWLIENGVFLNSGQFAYSDQPGHFRMVFSQDADKITTAIQRIRQALDKLGSPDGEGTSSAMLPVAP